MDGAGAYRQAGDVMETRSEKIARLRLMLVASDLAVPKDYTRQAELLRLLADELAKDRPNQPDQQDAAE
jgi:hypothetical protein